VLASRHLFRGRELLVQATAYSLAVEDCEKEPDDPDYGITASGEEVENWHTIAADKSIPLGTKVYIPYFRDKPNKGLFVVDDRGGAIKGNKIDIYMSNREDAKKWGRRTLSIFILEE
jgi:3D (Asp-Asp-Asp) domain-containing protein